MSFTQVLGIKLVTVLLLGLGNYVGDPGKEESLVVIVVPIRRMARIGDGQWTQPQQSVPGGETWSFVR
ncbi:hypothetical protein N7495_000282 [Penicillium taxi]|uniref:uncharacterized protein n=1 Tax=Penicillium taxi TaxID=168475 RepID=UPI002544DFF1|nr:uncharacterized protein N7495_000282 [Penicillium taxi]KAJ5907600.1 hypothetical protein N7495_000282 [Penicillium taxi]